MILFSLKLTVFKLLIIQKNCLKNKEEDLLNKQKVARVCIHEAGHTLILWFLRGPEKFLEICVVPDPNGEYDGYTASEPRAESTRSQMMAEIACYYGGKIADLLFCVKSVGHGDDMRQAKKLARKLAIKLHNVKTMDFDAVKKVLDTLPASEWMEHEQKGEKRSHSSMSFSAEEESVFEEVHI